MPRSITSTTQAILEANQTKLCALVSLDFGSDGITRVNNTGFNLTWDGNEYIGLGQLGAISAAEESSEVQSYDMTFSLYSQDPVLLAKALGANYRGKFAALWVAALDDDYNVVEDTDGIGPILLFSGRMYNMEINVGKQGSISVIASSRLSDWENAHGGRYSHRTQTSRVDENDSGFEYITVIANIEIVWGSTLAVGTTVTPIPVTPTPPVIRDTPSDIRLKTNIVPEFILNGNQWYSFNYITGGPRHLGVMAQEIIDTNPDAVSIGSDGYYRVNYEKL